MGERQGFTAVSRLSLLLALLALFPMTAFAQQRRQTIPVPPKSKARVDFSRMWLSAEVPEAPEKLRIVTSAAFDGQDTGSSQIYVYGFDRSGKRFAMGTVAEGTEVTISDFALKGRTLYYTLPYDLITPTVAVKGIAPKIAWISGRNLQVLGVRPDTK